MESFDQLYKEHFDALHRYAYTIVKDSEAGADVVQECFINLYNRLKEGVVIDNIPAYLFRSVHNKSLTFLNAKRSNVLPLEPFSNELHEPATPLDKIVSVESTTEIKAVIETVLSQLPPQCRTVFEKSRLEHKKYADIALELNISQKTVEAHMSKALKLIREFIRVNKPFLSLLTILLIQICLQLTLIY